MTIRGSTPPGDSVTFCYCFGRLEGLGWVGSTRCPMPTRCPVVGRWLYRRYGPLSAAMRSRPLAAMSLPAGGQQFSATGRRLRVVLQPLDRAVPTCDMPVEGECALRKIAAPRPEFSAVAVGRFGAS